MKRHELNLDDIFEKARNEEPVFSESDAHTLLEKSGSNNQTNPINNILHKIGKKPMNIVAFTTVAAVAVSILTFNNSDNGVNNKIINNKNNNLSGKNYASANIENVKPIAEPETNTFQSKSKDIVFDDKINNDNKTLVAKQDETKQAPVDEQKIMDNPTPDDKGKVSIKGVNMITLTMEQLESLGIKITQDNKKGGSVSYWDSWKTDKPSFNTVFVKGGVRFDDNTNENHGNNIISPRMITDQAGNKRLLVLGDKDEQLIKSTYQNFKFKNPLNGADNSKMSVTEFHVSNPKDSNLKDYKTLVNLKINNLGQDTTKGKKDTDISVALIDNGPNQDKIQIISNKIKILDSSNSITNISGSTVFNDDSNLSSLNKKDDFIVRKDSTVVGSFSFGKDNKNGTAMIMSDKNNFGIIVTSDSTLLRANNSILRADSSILRADSSILRANLAILRADSPVMQMEMEKNIIVNPQNAMDIDKFISSTFKIVDSDDDEVISLPQNLPNMPSTLPVRIIAINKNLKKFNIDIPKINVDSLMSSNQSFKNQVELFKKNMDSLNINMAKLDKNLSKLYVKNSNTRNLTNNSENSDENIEQQAQVINKQSGYLNNSFSAKYYSVYAKTLKLQAENMEKLAENFNSKEGKADKELAEELKKQSEGMKKIAAEMEKFKQDSLNLNFYDKIPKLFDSLKFNSKLNGKINIDSLFMNIRKDCFNNLKMDDPLLISHYNLNENNSANSLGFGVDVLKNSNNQIKNAKLNTEKYENVISQIEDDMDKYIKINKLIPVYIDMGVPAEQVSDMYEKGKGKENFGFIFWYDATPEFLAVLPEPVRKQIESEMNELAQTTDICSSSAVAGDNNYLDLWRSCSGAIENLTAFPNPAQAGSRINLKYNLTSSRYITISIHDLQGNKIRELSSRDLKSAGKWEEALTLKDIQPGMYLISVQTEKGEKAVQRVVIE